MQDDKTVVETANTEAFEAEVTKLDELRSSFDAMRADVAQSVTRIREEIAHLEMEDAVERTREWVRENPAAASAIALGAGLLVGAALSSLRPEPPPPTLRARARRYADTWGSTAGDYVGDLGGRVVSAGDTIRRKAGEAGTVLARRADEFAADVARHAADVARTIAETAGDAAEVVQERTAQASSAVQGRTTDGFDLLDSAFRTVKTALAGVVVKKVSDLIRRIQ